MLKHETIEENVLREYSAVVLAYIGDAVFELAVRSHIVANGNRKIKDIHHDTVELVKAASQAQVIRRIYPELTEKEQDVVMRGRNAKSSPTKHAHPQDYQLSTGFEALLGYHYLLGNEERLEELVGKVLNDEN